VERGQRALEPLARRGGATEPELRQRREGAGLAALVGHLQRLERGHRADRFGQRFVVGAEPHVDLGAVERGQRGDRGRAVGLGLLAAARQAGQRRLVAVLEEV